jgi:hypothetical protein
MRRLITFLLIVNLLWINVAFGNAISSTSDELKPICDAHFKEDDSPCSLKTPKGFGTVETSYLINFGVRTLLLKINKLNQRFYQEVFLDKPGITLSEKDSFAIDYIYDPQNDSPIKFDCQEQRLKCNKESEVLVDNSACFKAQSTTFAFAQPMGFNSTINDTQKITDKMHSSKDCSNERKNEIKLNSCDGKRMSQLAGDCLFNIFKGALNALSGASEFIYDALVFSAKIPLYGLDAVFSLDYAAKVQALADAPITFVKNWWAETEKAENSTSDALTLMAFSDKDSLEKTAVLVKKEPSGLFDRFTKYIFDVSTEAYGCQKWSGVPYGKGSTCLESFISWECSDCGVRANVFCGAGGFLVGEVGAAFLLGGFLKYVAKGVKPTMNVMQRSADTMQGVLSRSIKIVPSPEKVSWFGSSVQMATGAVTLAADKLSKVKSIPIDFLLGKLRSARLYVGSKISPTIMTVLAANSLHAPNEAAKWYWRKLEVAFAKGVGSKKEKEILKEHAEQDLEKAKAMQADAQKLLVKGDKKKSLAVKTANIRLVAAEERFRKAQFASDLFDLKNLKGQFASTALKNQKELAAKTKEPLSRSQIAKLRAEAIIAGEIEQGKNLLIAFKGIQIINKFPKATYQELLEKVAPLLHESWRESRKATKAMIDKWLSNEKKRISEMPASEKALFNKIEEGIKTGNYPEHLPRIKPKSSGKKFENDEAIDIANTSYKDLTPHWQADNQAASKNILDVLVSYQGKDGIVKSPMFLKIQGNLDPKDPDYLLKMGQLFNGSSHNNDPLVHAAAREFNKWKQRTDTTYSREVEAVLVIQAYQEVTGTKDSAEELVDTIVKPE